MNIYLLVLPEGSALSAPDLEGRAHPEAHAVRGHQRQRRRLGWRLRAVENRLTAIETELRHRPTKADLESLKNWMLLRLGGLILLGVAVITLIDRLLPP